MNVSRCMSADVRIADPSQTIREAARIMKSLDAGALPVGENDRLVGMITDRDIAIRAVADGKGPETKVREVMTEEIEYCFDDEPIEAVARKMSDLQVRRLPVLSREKRLVGIISLGDIAQSANPARVGQTLGEVSQPGGRHTQH
jgi:CBS domain-containing protein